MAALNSGEIGGIVLVGLFAIVALGFGTSLTTFDSKKGGAKRRKTRSRRG